MIYICTYVQTYTVGLNQLNHQTIQLLKSVFFLGWTTLFMFLATKQQQFLAKATSMSFGPLWPGQEATSHLSQGPVRAQTWKDHAMAAMDQKWFWNPVVVLMHS